jgi:hypothetical protein
MRDKKPRDGGWMADGGGWRKGGWLMADGGQSRGWAAARRAWPGMAGTQRANLTLREMQSITINGTNSVLVSLALSCSRETRYKRQSGPETRRRMPA